MLPTAIAAGILTLLLLVQPAFGVVTLVDVNPGAALPDDAETGKPRFLLGETIIFPDDQTVLEFTDPEQAVISEVRRVVDGPQPVDVRLPVASGTFDTADLPVPSEVVGTSTSRSTSNR